MSYSDIPLLEINMVSKLTGTDGNTHDIASKVGRGIVVATMSDLSTNTAFLATADGITELYDGLMILLRNTVVASASGCTLNLNSLGAKSINRSNSTSDVTTHFALNTEYIFIYKESANVWEMQMGFDTTTDTKVRQTLVSTDVNRPLLMSYQNNENTTTNVDNVSYRNNSIYANPSTGEITANKFNGNATVAEGIDCEATNMGGSTYHTTKTLKQKVIRPSSYTTDANGCIDITSVVSNYAQILNVSCSVSFNMSAKVDVSFTPVYYKTMNEMDSRILLRCCDRDGVRYINTPLTDFLQGVYTVDILYV